MLKFDCLRCGDCCKNLIKETREGVASGLALFPEETKHFLNESVLPYRGFGRYPEEKNFKIVMFQLRVDTCPHFEKAGILAKCRIYENRPLSCKCYPFQPIKMNRYGRIIFYADPGCRAIQKTKEQNPKAMSQKGEIEASREEKYGYLLWDTMSKIHITAQGWTFDIRYREWIPSFIRTGVTLKNFKPSSKIDESMA